MAGAWLAPLCMFWLYVWGPLRPFTYPSGQLFPGLLSFVSTGFACGLAWWMPHGYFKIRKFERNGRLYETLGIRWFRRFVPDGDIANRLRRRKDPRFRLLTRTSAMSFLRITENSERGHLVLFLVGAGVGRVRVEYWLARLVVVPRDRKCCG
jgi:hypothetical protein